MKCLTRYSYVWTSVRARNRCCYISRDVAQFRTHLQELLGTRPVHRHAASTYGHRSEPTDIAFPKTKDSTIYALSTAVGKAALAIIRCSGPDCLTIYGSLCPNAAPPKPRHATLRTLFGPGRSPLERQILDPGALVLFFPAPRTATGEDVLEFHVHSGPAIVKAVLSAISNVTTTGGNSSTSIRYAEPGEFTRRAFYNDRLDLSQIEALGDTLSAETEQQRRLAVRGASGSLYQRYESWRYLLLQARGELEAFIDFSEDQHFDDSPAEQISSVTSQVLLLRNQIIASIQNAIKGELLRNGIKIALLGAPNAGKSSLLNQIVGREAAIVSAEAGTTRDVVEINVDIGGFFCTFGDLAGLRTTSSSPAIGQVEQEGIRRAEAKARSADLIIVVLSFEPNLNGPDGFSARLEPDVNAMVQQLEKEGKRIIYAVNKKDLVPNFSFQDPMFHGLPPSKLFPISCTMAQTYSSTDSEGDQSGIQSLLLGLIREFQSMTMAEDIDPNSSSQPRLWDESLGASERQRLLLQQCREQLDKFLGRVQEPVASELGGSNEIEEVDIVLAAESLRSAAECLARITGRGEGGDAEEVLGVVFQKFCVGK